MKKKTIWFVILAAVCVLCIILAVSTDKKGEDVNLAGTVISEEASVVYTNSPLVSYTCLSPNHNGQRTHTIDTITIHCCVGQCSVERMGEIYAPESRKSAYNYGVGFDGRIGLYVDEANSSMSTSSDENDQRAINIVVASDTTEPYAVNDKAYNALIKLVADICKRNGIDELVWSTSKDNRLNRTDGCNITVHRDFANKSCPGKFLYDRMGDVAKKVNMLIEKTPKDDGLDPETKAATFDNLTVGEIVSFTGEYFFTAPAGSTTMDVSACKARVEVKYKASALHPVYLQALDDDGNDIPDVKGWCNLSDIEKLN